MNQPTDPIPQPNSEPPVPDAEAAADAELAALQSHMLQLEAQGQNGANWFYWVAGLSLVNSVIAIVGGGIAFVVGMGVTEIVDVRAAVFAAERPDMATVAKVGAFGFSLIASAIVAGFGWLSNKRLIPIFALGMLLYALDGVIFVLDQQWMCVAFHGFALFSMWQGLNAYRQLSAILRTQPALS